MVCHVNDCVAVESSLIYQLDTRLDATARALEMFSRLVHMPEDEKLDKSITDFIGNYSMYCAGVEELQEPQPMEAVNKVLLGNLKDAVERISKTLSNAFDILTNSQARVKKNFTEIKSTIGPKTTLPDAVKMFHAIPCKVISLLDASRAVEKNTRLVELINVASTSKDSAAIYSAIKKFRDTAGVDLDQGKLQDLSAGAVASSWDGFVDAGWTVDNLVKMVDAHVKCLNNIEVLKGARERLQKDNASLLAQLDTLIKESATAEQGRLIQQLISNHLFATRVVSSGISILLKRVAAISNILKAIVLELDRVYKEAVSRK